MSFCLFDLKMQKHSLTPPNEQQQIQWTLSKISESSGTYDNVYIPDLGIFNSYGLYYKKICEKFKESETLHISSYLGSKNLNLWWCYNENRPSYESFGEIVDCK